MTKAAKASLKMLGAENAESGAAKNDSAKK